MRHNGSEKYYPVLWWKWVYLTKRPISDNVSETLIHARKRRCFYKSIVFRHMTDIALTPAEMDLTLKKLGLIPKKIGVKGSMTPKFQSLN